MTKGDDTKTTILNAGLNMASQLGLENVTIGGLAKATNMSKSGLFAHFSSKENLQIEILDHAGRLFSEMVVQPALKLEPGIERIKALFKNWIDWNADLKGGCIFVTASTDFKDRPGKVRDFLLRQQQDWIDCLKRVAESATCAGVFRKNIDYDQFAFEFYSLLMGFHFYYKLLNSTDINERQQAALEKLMHSYR
jgi:AcrR family transcriptional regulator